MSEDKKIKVFKLVNDDEIVGTIVSTDGNGVEVKDVFLITKFINQNQMEDEVLGTERYKRTSLQVGIIPWLAAGRYNEQLFISWDHIIASSAIEPQLLAFYKNVVVENKSEDSNKMSPDDDLDSLFDPDR